MDGEFTILRWRQGTARGQPPLQSNIRHANVVMTLQNWRECDSKGVTPRLYSSGAGGDPKTQIRIVSPAKRPLTGSGVKTRSSSECSGPGCQAASTQGKSEQKYGFPTGTELRTQTASKDVKAGPCSGKRPDALVRSRPSMDGSVEMLMLASSPMFARPRRHTQTTSSVPALLANAWITYRTATFPLHKAGPPPQTLPGTSRCFCSRCFSFSG